MHWVIEQVVCDGFIPLVYVEREGGESERERGMGDERGSEGREGELLYFVFLNLIVLLSFVSLSLHAIFWLWSVIVVRDGHTYLFLLLILHFIAAIRWFESHFVGNHEARFSQVMAHMYMCVGCRCSLLLDICIFLMFGSPKED